MTNHPKTLEEHRGYLYDIVHLKLFFLHSYLSEHPEELFEDAIRNRVDIYRKTDANPGLHTPSEVFFDAPAWRDMELEAKALFDKYKSDKAAFEDTAFAVFKPSIDARCERDYYDNSVLARYQCGSLRHELALADDGKTMVFHIANAIRPRSIFEEPSYLKECFARLLDVSQNEFGAERISTGTWLNSHKAWLSYFPEEWFENMSHDHENVNWSYGFWGQFINSRGTFNEKYGEKMRMTNRFPYYPRTSSCSIKNMRKML